MVLHNFPVSNSKCGNQIHCCNPNNKVVYYIRNIVHNNKSQCLLAPISCVNVTTWNVQFVQFERLILIWGQLKWRIQREFDFRTCKYMDKKVVVLIDSGINKLDFCDCLVGGKHFYVEENYVCCDDSFDDDNGHGSACAYTIKSIFPETQFYIIKILDQNLETVYPVLEAALEHCMDLKYHIINLSLSLLEEVGSVNLKLICDALQKKGKIIVASVSNGHRQSFPAAYPSVIGVRGSFFSSSEEYWYNSKEDIQCIADISPTFTSWTLDNYFMFSGNSRACAVISGLLLKLETDYNMILNLESAGLILEKNATRNDWTENDIVAFTDTYVIGHQQVCDQSVLVAVHQILSDIMGWGDNIVVDLNTNLFKNGLIHTNKIKQLIIDLEKQFGITINHSNIKYTSLCSINSIGKLIGGIVDEKTKIDS